MSNITFNSVPTKRLSESISGSASTFKVNSITGWDGVDLTSADFGTRMWAVFRNSANTLMEIMEIDPTTITAASSAITIIARGLKFNGDQSTSVSNNKLTWIKGDTVVELGTSVPQLFEMTVRTLGDQSIGGIKTFTSLPTIPVTPVASTDAASKGYVDLTATGTATYNQNIVAGTVGESVTSGNVLYLKSSDGKWYIADSATASKSVGVTLGIAQATVLSGVATTILVGGLDAKQTGLTAGLTYYLSTAGAISTTKGTNIRFIGRVPYNSTTTILVDFSSNDPELVLVDGSRTYVADTGAADAYVMTVVPAISAYKAGQIFSFKAVSANTTTSTVNINGLGVKTIKKNGGGTNLVANDILAGQVVTIVYDGTNFQMINPVGTPNSYALSADIQIFNTPGATTWTKPTGAKVVEVWCFGGGGGGGSGKRNTTSTAASGGGGGGGGSVAYKRFSASTLGGTEALVVGAGGAGGAVKSTDGAGNVGSDGVASSFGTNKIVAPAGLGGAGGTTNPTAGGAGGVIGFGDITIVGGAGGQGNISGTGTTGVDSTNVISPRGGGGGGEGDFGGSSDPKAGGGFVTYYVLAGGIAAASAGATGGAGATSDSNLLIGGVGGGGGAGTTNDASGSGGTGGAGGYPGGGGGGGGGCDSTSGTNSGAGGAGSKGMVVVISYF